MKGGRRSPRPANPGAAGICDLTHGGPALGRTGALLGHGLPELPLDPLPPRSPAAPPSPASSGPLFHTNEACSAGSWGSHFDFQDLQITLHSTLFA